MGGKRNSTSFGGKAAGSLAASLGAGVLLLSAALALAQESGKPVQPLPPEQSGFIGAVGRWLDDHATWLGSGLRGAQTGVENIGHEAGLAAKSTVEGAKDAAGAVTRFPTRVVSGHEQCAIAPNGAPDCVAAANALCRSKGFGSGASVDMTTAEICPAKVYLAGRNSGPECHTETFVSRALCQ
jgi:hypothetical protein